MLLHAIGSASDSGGWQVPTLAAQQARGPRDAWHRHRAAAGGQLRDWYAICGTQPFADSETLQRIGRLKSVCGWSTHC